MREKTKGMLELVIWDFERSSYVGLYRDVAILF